jgi:hypothetical protein
MAGVNFMALAEGMMLGDKLNKEDETYWRKQAKEDRDMAYQERDQAYKEQTQGYALDDYKEKAETVEASRFISQASDILSAAAKAQGKPKWQVMLESPEFTLPEGSATLQSKVQSGIRAGLVATEAMNLRARGDLRNAERLEQHYGMSQRSDVGAMQAYSDAAIGDKRVMDLFPGATVNEKGNYIIGGQEVPRGVALGLTFNPSATPATYINQYKVNEQAAAQALAAQQGQTNQAQIQQINSRNLEKVNYEDVRQAVRAGYTEEQMPPPLRELFRTMKGAAAPVTTSGSPPIGVSIDAATAAPKPAAAPVSVAPAAIKPVAPMPISLEDWRNTLGGSQSTDPMGAVTGSNPPDAAPQSFESAVNHFSSQQLEAMRSNITSGKGLPGMSPRATAAALQTINDEIASRHKAQAVRYQRGMKQ